MDSQSTFLTEHHSGAHTEEDTVSILLLLMLQNFRHLYIHKWYPSSFQSNCFIVAKTAVQFGKFLTASVVVCCYNVWLQETWSAVPHAAIVAAPNVASATTLQAAESLGTALAQKLLDAGATEILKVAKRQMAEEIMRRKAAKQNAASSSGDTASGTSS